MERSDSDDIELARSRSKARAAAFLAAVDPSLDQRDDRIAAELSRENASAKAKLGKLYRLLAEVAQTAAPFVACGKGCSACCKMNVSITSVEAERLAAVSGKPVVRPPHPMTHPEDKFSGVPCPFLVEDACSVYEVRPYVCRAHFSFDTSPHWCQPERAYVGDMGMVEFGGAKAAYQAIAGSTPLGGFADIRDFFPPEP
jgi:Fe-S-cluster containining protein